MVFALLLRSAALFSVSLAMDDPMDMSSLEAHTPLTSEQLRKLHEKLDLDSNGKVHIDEIHAQSKMVRDADALKDIRDSEWIEALDANKDGKIGVEEFASQFGEGNVTEGDSLEWFEKAKIADADGDGFLTTEEELLAVFHEQTNPEVFAVSVKHAFNRSDEDQDGTISKEEYDNHVASADFDDIDANKDGNITVDEYGYLMSGQAFEDVAWKELMEHADKDNDSHISADEFVNSVNITELDGYHRLVGLADHYEL